MSIDDRSLKETIFSIVVSANALLPFERRVTPRDALTVAERSLTSNSLLSDDTRVFNAIRDVHRFIALATRTVVVSSVPSVVEHSDLLPEYHPLSTRERTLSPEEFTIKAAEWVAADPFIDDSVRSLVASMYMAPVDSLVFKHVRKRIEMSNAIVPDHIYEFSALVASYRDGNSSAARRARVALQWRDRYGRWVEMGRGVDFKLRLPSGDIVTAHGVYVGAASAPANAQQIRANRVNFGLVQVIGDKNLPDGIYPVYSENGQVYKARIPDQALQDANIDIPIANDTFKSFPTLDQLNTSRLNAPVGWTLLDGTKDTYFSDDSYAVTIRDGKYTVHRLNFDGSVNNDIVEIGRAHV